MIENLPLTNRLILYIEDSTAPFQLKQLYSGLEIYSLCENDRCETLMKHPEYHNRKLCPNAAICIAKDKNNIRVQLTKYQTKGIIEKSKTVAERYRRIDNKKNKLDIVNADPGVFLDVKYPMGLERVILTMPKFLAVVPGASGAGKSAYLLNFCLLNLDKYVVHYFANTEMTANRIKKRLLDHPNIGMYNMDNLNCYEREDNFADVIEPDGINVIDYIEVSSERPSGIADDLASIQSHLKGGMALVAIQKKTNQKDQRGKVWENELGVGGEWSKRKADLYITIDHYPENKLVIRKARERKHDHVNPVGMEWTFNLRKGIEFFNVVDPEGIPQSEQPQQVSIDIDFGGEEA